MSYVDNYGNKTKDYPFNPNGSIDGATGFCNIDGRINIMMPHPERLCYISIIFHGHHLIGKYHHG
jgi:phosphoribosylformylglycinamidine synthase